MAPQRANILVVEDDDLFQSTLMDLLTDIAERNVTAVRTGADALALLDTVRPDLILIDIKLPGFDGFIAYRLIRDCADVSAVPVLFLSELTSAEIFMQIDQPLGPYKRLNKPFNIGDFDAVVDDLLGGVAT